MKVQTYLDKLIAEQKCSLHTAENLDVRLHAEGKLSNDRHLRFRPLYADFVIAENSQHTSELQNVGLGRAFTFLPTAEDVQTYFSKQA